MRAKVELHDVVVLQHSGVAGVGRVVGGALVEGDAGGEGEARLQPVGLDQAARRRLHRLTGTHRDYGTRGFSRLAQKNSKLFRRKKTQKLTHDGSP